MEIEFRIVPVLTTFGELKVGDTFINFDDVKYKKIAAHAYGSNHIMSYVGLNVYLNYRNVLVLQDHYNVRAIIPIPLTEIEVGQFFSSADDPNTVWIKTNGDYVLINGNGNIPEHVYLLEKI